jgi:hypothetical protein
VRVNGDQKTIYPSSAVENIFAADCVKLPSVKENKEKLSSLEKALKF